VFTSEEGKKCIFSLVVFKLTIYTALTPYIQTYFNAGTKLQYELYQENIIKNIQTKMIKQNEEVIPK
jgi:hypothetical protein